MTKSENIFISYGKEALQLQCIPITHAPSHYSEKAIQNEAASASDNKMVFN